LADLPAGVAVPIRPNQALQIPRALTPREMAALTNTNGNIEFSQTFLRSGGTDTYWLTRASATIPNKVSTLPFVRGGTSLISHSHPIGYGGAASAADYDVLRALGQNASRVVRPDGTSVRFSLGFGNF